MAQAKRRADFALARADGLLWSKRKELAVNAAGGFEMRAAMLPDLVDSGFLEEPVLLVCIPSRCPPMMSPSVCVWAVYYKQIPQE